MKCQKCQKETFLPFKCPYCENYYCAEHRLPENHQCPQMQQARTPIQQTQPITLEKQKPYYTVTYPPIISTRKKIYFSNKEIKHLTVAAILVTGIGLSMGIFPDVYTKMGGPIMLAAFTAILTTSFFIHELAHKITAQKEGLWAEFRLVLTGAILTLVSIISPLFKVISPGAVIVSGLADIKSVGKISVTGPATNLTLSTIFLATALLIPQNNLIFLLGAAFNAWIALFNLIPFGIFDGFKVLLWNKKIWALAFTASLALTIISYIYIL